MGLFDKLKNKAQQAINQVQNQASGAPQQGHDPQAYDQQAYQQQAHHQGYAQQGQPQHAGPSFQWDGDVYPMPPGWDGLSIDEWFYKHEKLRDRQMHIDQERLPPMTDADGDRLDPEEVLLVHEYGFRSGGHFEAYRNWAMSGWAQQTGLDFTDCAFRYGGVARERIMAEKAGAMSGPGGALSPIEGVSCEQWARMQAQLAGGGNLDQLLAQAGMDRPKWDRVSAEWMTRMSTDTSMAITTVYGNAFSSGGAGQYSQQATQAVTQGVGGNVGAEPVPFETYVHVMVAQNAAYQKGQDANAVLAQFGMTALDWSNIGAYWSKKTQQEAMKYHQLMIEYQAKYEGMYGLGDGMTSDQREIVVVDKLLEMAGTGQAAQMIAYLQQKFPDDAQDYDALDWWFGKACDKCVEHGDRNRAQQLLWARFPLQSDQSEGVNAYIQSEMESLF
jgi:hypothetical protein